MDFPIPHNICPFVLGDIICLLDVAKQHGLPITTFPYAAYLSRNLDKQLNPPAAPVAPTQRRRTKAYTKKAQKAAATAQTRRAHNDTRQRLAARAHAFAHRKVLHHEAKDAPYPTPDAEDQSLIHSDSDSDSNVPLSHRFSNRAPSIFPLTTPTLGPTSSPTSHASFAPPI
jgi:hypothetical protein